MIKLTNGSYYDINILLNESIKGLTYQLFSTQSDSKLARLRNSTVVKVADENDLKLLMNRLSEKHLISLWRLKQKFDNDITFDDELNAVNGGAWKFTIGYDTESDDIICTGRSYYPHLTSTPYDDFLTISDGTTYLCKEIYEAYIDSLGSDKPLSKIAFFKDLRVYYPHVEMGRANDKIRSRTVTGVALK